MNSAACSVVSYALNATWEIPLIASSGWIASRVVRRWGPQPQHVVWTATWMLSILAPILPSSRSIASSIGLSGRSADIAHVSIALHAAGAGATMQAAALLWPAWLIWLVFGLYATTLVYFAARLLWLFANARTLVRDGVPVKWNAETNELWHKVRRGFATDATILTSSSVRGILTIGVWKPAIILPAGFAEHSTEDELLSALGHEMAHIARRDYAKNLLYEAGSILTAFHPVSWALKAKIVQTREMTCDAMVVERLMDTKIYRQSLLRLAERMLASRSTNVHAVGMFDGNFLRERIMRMKTKQSIPGGRTRAALTAVAALSLLAAAIVGTTFAKTVNAQTANTKAPSEKVYKIGNGVSAPELVHAVDPEYSNEARLAKYQGVCVVSLIVDKQGNPQHIQVVRALGKGLDQKAIEAAKQYKFKPAHYHGKPVPVRVNIEVNFKFY